MDVEQAIERGIAAARANNQATAYYYFYSATQADPTNEQAWLWRASTAPQPRDALYCLAAVLALNPDNLVARHGLEQISAAVAAETTPEAVSITPSLSAADYKPPERRLEWQQSFQRDLYDLARVPRMEPLDGAVVLNGAAPAAPEAESIVYRRPPRVGQRLGEAVRRVFVDRDTQRVQFAIPVVIAVVVLIGGVALLGLGQLTSPVPAGATPTSGGASTATLGGPATATLPGGAIASVTSQLSPSVPPASATVGPKATATRIPPTETLPSLSGATATRAGSPPSPTTAPPSATVRPPTSTVLPPTSTAAPPPSSATPPVRTITVAAGQTLPVIARQQGVSVAALWAYNQLTNVRDVRAGSTLKIPPAGYKPPAEVKYVVQSGDAVFNIAQLFGTTVDAIAQRNDLADPGQITAGQTLIVPVP